MNDGVGGDVFDRLVANRRALVAAEATEIALICQAADEYEVTPGASTAACERLVRGGADGTPLIGEFLALEVGALLGLTPAAAALRIASALNLRHRHPQLWAAVQTGDLRVWQADRIVAACVEAKLTAPGARWVDAQIAVAAPALGWRRASARLAALIARADPGQASDLAQERRCERTVRIGEHRDGISTLYARLDTPAALALDDLLAQMSHVLMARGSTEDASGRRATALGLLADPEQALVLLAGGEPTQAKPPVTLYVHVTPTSEIADAEGLGQLALVTSWRFLQGCTVTVKPVIDVADAPASHAYAISDRIREHVTLRQPIEMFPFSNTSARSCDLDHTVPYQLAPPGSPPQTTPHNLAPLSRRVHRAKTSGAWQVERVDDDTLRWTSPVGYRYEVSPQGTRLLGRGRPQPARQVA